jgi:hypothetical protein
MDNAIWATWYDLGSGDHSDYFDWLNQEYLPSLRARPGYAWAAHYQSGAQEGTGMGEVRKRLGRMDDPTVGTGTQYLMLAGAVEAATLVAPSVFSNDIPLTAEAERMFARRTGVRTCLFSVFGRVDGPEAGLRPPGTTPGPVIQMGSFRTRTIDDEYDVCAWYAQHRLPAIAHMPGCIAARVMVSCAGWAKFSVMYEFTSAEARQKNFEERHETLGESEVPWTHRVHDYTMHAPGSPTVGTRLWPPVG